MMQQWKRHAYNKPYLDWQTSDSLYCLVLVYVDPKIFWIPANGSCDVLLSLQNILQKM